MMKNMDAPGLGRYRIEGEKKMKLNELNLHDIGNTIQLVGAIYARGEGETYYVPFPDEDMTLAWNDDKGVHVLVMDLEEWKIFLKQSDVLETEVTARAGDGTIEKAILRKSQRMVEQSVSWNVFRRDAYACRYCGRNDVPLTVDHLVRWEEGGPSIEANLLSSCKKCNRIRGDTSYAAWLEHDYYRKVAKALSIETYAANIALVSTLVAIPRLNYVRKR